MKSKLLTFITFVLITITGCDYFENSDTLNTSSIEININGLPSIPDSMTYIGWFEKEENGVKTYTKAFIIDANSNGAISYKSEKPFQILQEAQVFNLNIEKESIANDSNLVPNSLKLLSGRFSESSTSLTISDQSLDFSKIKAVFNLVTPTNGPNSDELSGVWFVDSLNTSLQAGLDLPPLYGGWIYEVWIEKGGQFISTGRFADAEARDLYANYGGSLSGFNFPGEDFLINAPAGWTFPLDISGAKVIVSIEYNDGRLFGTSPLLKILETTVPSSPQSGISYNLLSTNISLCNGYGVMVVDLVK